MFALARGAWLFPTVSLGLGLKPTGQVNKLQVAWQAPLKKGEPEISDDQQLGFMILITIAFFFVIVLGHQVDKEINGNN